MENQLTEEREKLWEKLEGFGVDEVRIKHAGSQFGSKHSKRSIWVEEWLNRKTRESDAAILSRQEEREEETLSIARSADSIAREALRIARHERVIAVIAAIAAIVAAIVAAVVAVAE